MVGAAAERSGVVTTTPASVLGAEVPWCSTAERRRLVRVCTAITGDPVAAEDLAQETLVQAWRIRDRLQDPAAASAWLDAIARHVCRRWRTHQARRSRHEVTTVVDGDAPEHDPVGDLLERDELADLLDRALGLLPADTRAALVARYVEGLTPAEIARRLRTSPDAVSMRLLRGRTRLRTLMEDELADEPAARVWTARHGVAWRRTRLRCALCATAGVELRRDGDRALVELRCPRCSTDVASAYRLDDPVQGPLLAGVSRPSALLARMADWAAAYWPADGVGRVSCTRCAAEVIVTPYARPDVRDAREARGWRAACPRCGAEQTTSWGGVALLQPATRALRRRRPAAHAVPTRHETVAGRPVVVVGFRDDASGDGVDVRFSGGPDARLLAVTPA